MKFTKYHKNLVGLARKLDDKSARWQNLKDIGLLTILEASDCMLMNQYQDASHQELIQYDTEKGILELGPFLYNLHHPPTGMKKLTKMMVKAMLKAEGLGELPKSKFSKKTRGEMLDLVKEDGGLDEGGSIWGTDKYEKLDVGWIYSLFKFVTYQLGLAEIHKFGTTPSIIEASKSKPVRIAIVGDWGTGKFGKHDGPAVAVMNGIEKRNPDYVIHLGDVYYAGTESEEEDNFLDLWPDEFNKEEGMSFALNSNHEMYDGANGYFKEALKSDGPFKAQNQTSYFGIRHGEWLFLGLDTAYYADPNKLYRDPDIGGMEGDQATWIRNNFKDQDTEKVIVLTHHTPVNYSGEKLNDQDDPPGLWKQVFTALGDKVPGIWYFGHAHNGIVYSESSATGLKGCKARLAGHGAIPFGKSAVLKKSLDSGIIEYFARNELITDSTGVRTTNSIRVRNGFATIDIDSQGLMTERFFEVVDGSSEDPQLVWSKPPSG